MLRKVIVCLIDLIIFVCLGLFVSYLGQTGPTYTGQAVDAQRYNGATIQTKLELVDPAADRSQKCASS